MTERIRLCYTRTDDEHNTEFDIDISSEKCNNDDMVEHLRRYLRAAGFNIHVEEMPDIELTFDENSGFSVNEDYDPRN